MKFALLFLFLPSLSFCDNLDAYRDIIELASKKAKVNPGIVAGVLMAESEGKADAVSKYRPDGYRDEGIAQLNNRYLKYFAWKYNNSVKVDPFSPKSAIPVAAQILANNYKLLGNWIEAIAAYRQGVYGVLSNGVTHESSIYVEKVLKYGYLKKWRVL